MILRTRKRKVIGLRVRSAMALAVYVVLLFFTHVRVLELDEQSMTPAPSGQFGQYEYDSAPLHLPHPAADDQIDDVTACPMKSKTFLVHDLIQIAEFLLEPLKESAPFLAWAGNQPAPAQVRSPGQPRSPPAA